MTLRRPESALVVIYDELRRVLVLQRQDDPDFWQSVTGTLEWGESPRQTAQREVFEETGIDIEANGLTLLDCRVTNQYPIRPMWQHRYPAHSKVNTEYVFSVQVCSDSPIILTEHLDYAWLSKSEAMNKVWSSTNRSAINDWVPS